LGSRRDWRYGRVEVPRHHPSQPRGVPTHDRRQAGAPCRSPAASREARVVDIACGKGEFLIRLAEAYGIRGTGIDISPFCIADAQNRLQARAPGAEVAFRQLNGSDFRLDVPHSLTLASCIGASLGIRRSRKDFGRALGHGCVRWLGNRRGAILASGAFGRVPRSLGVTRDAFGDPCRQCGGR